MSVWFNPAREIDALLRKAAASVPGLEGDFNPELKPSDPRHADFQANGILAAAKKAKANPRALATALLEALQAQGGELPGPDWLVVELSRCRSPTAEVTPPPARANKGLSSRCGAERSPV